VTDARRTWGIGFLIVLGTLLLLVASSYLLRSYERSSLIQYQGTIVDASVNSGGRRALGLDFSVDLKVLYDGSHLETHSIKSSLNRSKLRAILEQLKEAKGETVRVRFLSDDRTLAEVVKLDGEVVLPLSHVKEASQFTAIAMGLFGFLFLGIPLFDLIKRNRKRTSDD